MKVHAIKLVVAILVAQVSGYVIKVPPKSVVTPSVTGSAQWLHIQELMIPLFENVCEISKNPNISKLAKEFTFNSTNYMKPEVITNVENLISSGLLPKGTIFSEYNTDHLNELKIIYELLLNAKDFNEFYKSAAWARQNLNCALYINAIYMTIQNRRDTEKLFIPAPYELLPNYFIKQQVIIQAAIFFTKDYNDYVVPSESIHSEGDSYIIDSNYTAPFYDNDGESKLAYFREDVGLNSYYFLKKLRMAPWFNDGSDERFGENMLQMMTQLLARYNLERYANGLPEVDSINWEAPINVSYDPMLIYSNGNVFGHRASSVELSENEDILQMRTIENNLLDVVGHMQKRGYNKKQILNQLMEILVTGTMSYETLARKLFGKDVSNSWDVSVLGHYMTSLRDPIFWKITTNIVSMVNEALKMLPTYTRNELFFPGVEVVNIDVKKITTAYDYFIFDVTDALNIKEGTEFRVKIGQPRLNHKKFTIKVNISSLVSQKGIMKVYLGPKLMPGELMAKKHLFNLLDVCQINLKVGTNMITRSSDDMKHFSEDFMQLNTIRNNVEYATFGLDSFPLNSIQSQMEFPSRLILPKGTLQGLPLQMFVFIAPYYEASFVDSQNGVKFNNAILSPGYPFDLITQDSQIFGLPNAMMKYISIMQKDENKVENYGGPGVTRSWYNANSNDPSFKTNSNSKNKQFKKKYDSSFNVNKYNMDTNDFVSNEENVQNDYDPTRTDNTRNLRIGNQIDYSSKREPFDYKAKKAQFDKKNYSAQRNYTKFHTTANYTKDNVISTTIKDVESTSAKNIATIPRYDKDELNKIGAVDDFQKRIQEHFLEVEPLPLPAMLQKDLDEVQKFDYKDQKKTERKYKIKEKKLELDTLIKDAKNKQYMRDKVKEQVEEDNLKPLNTPKNSFTGNLEDIDLKTERKIEEFYSPISKSSKKYPLLMKVNSKKDRRR